MMNALEKEETELTEKHGELKELKTEVEYEKEISEIKQRLSERINAGKARYAKENNEMEKEKNEKVNKLKMEIVKIENITSSLINKNDMFVAQHSKKLEQESLTEIEKIKTQQVLAQTVEGLGKRKVFIQKLEKEWDKAKDEYDHLQHLIKVELKNIISTLIKPVSDYIPDLSYDSETNSLTYQNKLVTELSQSESINLAIRLMSLKDPNTLIVCDNMECFDKDKIHEVDWKKLNAIILRVGNSPVLKDSNPINTGGHN